MAGKTPSKIQIFGESKTPFEWSRDPRCLVSYEAFRNRIKSGMDPEQALTGASRQGYRANLKKNDPPARADYRDPSASYSAFGERKTIGEWAQDPRCAVSAKALRLRLRQGMAFEEALTATRNYQFEQYHGFGEAKNILKWAADPRCKVSRATLSRRLSQGVPLERALSAEPMPREERGRIAPTKWQAFGETKSARGWSKDPRSEGTDAMVRKHLAKGMTLEDALKRIAPDPWPPIVHDITGESRLVQDWARHPDCRVTEAALRMRLKNGIPLQEAMAAPPAPRRAMRKDYVTAFGETKTIFQWSLDPRCPVSSTTLRKRLDRGESLESAFRGPDNLLINQYG